MKKDKEKCSIELVKQRFKDLLNKKDADGEPIFLWIVAGISTIGMLLISILTFVYRNIPTQVIYIILLIGGVIAFFDIIALLLYITKRK